MDDCTEATELVETYDFLMKYIIVGEAGTGKSCLLHHFTHNTWTTFVPPPTTVMDELSFYYVVKAHSQHTIGVEFSSRTVRSACMAVGHLTVVPKHPPFRNPETSCLPTVSSSYSSNDEIVHDPGLVNFSGNNTTRGSMCDNSNTRRSDDGDGTCNSSDRDGSAATTVAAVAMAAAVTMCPASPIPATATTAM